MIYHETKLSYLCACQKEMTMLGIFSLSLKFTLKYEKGDDYFRHLKDQID